MKNKIHITSLALGAVLGALLLFTVAAATRSQAWDYRVIYQIVGGSANTPPKEGRETFEQRINAAAAEGWEVSGYAGESVLLRKPKK